MTANLTEAETLLERIEPWRGTAPAGYHPNVLGTMTSLLFMAHWYPREQLADALARPREVTTSRPRVTDGEMYFETCNVIRSVLAARDRYVMVELGGGYAARAVDCAVALRRLNPVKPLLVILEALPTYVEWCRHHFTSNALSPDEHWILNAIVSDRPVPECMYLQPRGFGNQVDDTTIGQLLDKTLTTSTAALAFVRSLVENGSARIENGRVLPDLDRRRARIALDPREWTVEQMQAEAIVPVESAQLGFVSALTLPNLLLPLERVDFMDVDIQFAEAKVLPPNLDLLRRKVKLLSIGTHSGEIHDALVRAFDPAVWEVVFDFTPWTTHETSLGSFPTQDGILTLVNRTLA
jgi:hypothetical protein